MQLDAYSSVAARRVHRRRSALLSRAFAARRRRGGRHAAHDRAPSPVADFSHSLCASDRRCCASCARAPAGRRPRVPDSAGARRAATPCSTEPASGTRRSSSRRRVSRARSLLTRRERAANAQRFARRSDATRALAPELPQIVAIQSLFYISLGFLLMLSLGAQHATRAALTRRAHSTEPGAPRGACLAGPIAPRLSLFYFFDYAAISAHSLMGWCAGRLAPASHALCCSHGLLVAAQDGHRSAPRQRCAGVRACARRCLPEM